MRLAVIGAGAVGARATRHLNAEGIHQVVLVGRDGATTLAEEVGENVEVGTDLVGPFDAVVLASRWGQHPVLAARAMRHAPLVVSVADSMEDVRGLLDLDAEARERGACLVIGAGFTPGFTGVLARHLSARFDHTDEIHLATVGTGGPWCARQHHRALGGQGLDYREGAWVPRAGGSGRELFWFPEPIGGRDCYRAALPDPLLLAPLFPGIRRVTARMAATRRDRLTARLPMLAPPHPDGGVGAVRVELRGWVGRRREVVAAAAIAAPSEAAGIVAAVTVEMLAGEPPRSGAVALAGLMDPQPFLARCKVSGLVPHQFVGAG